MDGGRSYRFRILQMGSLPLRPDGTFDETREHRATSILIWPADERPTESNAVLTDPCFTAEGYLGAISALEEMGISLERIERIFVTHGHGDHFPSFPPLHHSLIPPDPLELEGDPAFSGMALVPCPGHMKNLQALRFPGPDGKTAWVVGDAVLDEEWLRAWRYYWPNGYSAEEVAETWRSVAEILRADIIIPGHGGPIEVTPGLVEDLLDTFPGAECAAECPTVPRALAARLTELRSEGSRLAEDGGS